MTNHYLLIFSAFPSHIRLSLQNEIRLPVSRAREECSVVLEEECVTVNQPQCQIVEEEVCQNDVEQAASPAAAAERASRHRQS